MRNQFKVDGDVTYLTVKTGDDSVLVAIDTADLPRVHTFLGTWTMDLNGYIGIRQRANGRRRWITLHRFVTDAPAGLEVDHINHDKTDNRRRNLRVVSTSQNQLNRTKANSNNRTSGVRGVNWKADRNKWRAAVKVDRREIHLGYFDTLYEATTAVRRVQDALIEAI